MFHIPDVAFHASVHFAEFFGFTTEAGDLAPTCDSGFDVVANHVMANHLRIFQSVLEHVWAWSHHAHVTKKHVEELRRFVKAGFAQYVAPCCFAWVVLGGLQKVAVAVHFHASEFIEPKLFAVDAAALLFEKDWSGHSDFGDYCHYDENQGEEPDKEHKREGYVERSLYEAVTYGAEWVVEKAHIGHRPQHVKVQGLVLEVAHERHHKEVLEVLLAIAYDLFLCFEFVVDGQAAIHFLHAGILLQVGDDMVDGAQVFSSLDGFIALLVVEIAKYVIAHGLVVAELGEKSSVVEACSYHNHFAPVFGRLVIHL